MPSPTTAPSASPAGLLPSRPRSPWSYPFRRRRPPTRASRSYLAANSLPVVIANLQTWVMGILAAVATLFLVLAGVYWATAGGDPAQVDKAKGALKNALIGYGLAVLAPVLLQVVQGIVGG